MPLDKSIEHGKDWRRPYRGSAAFDYSCRHGGGCKYCTKERRFSGVKASHRASLHEQVGEWLENVAKGRFEA
jgi:hypothetical protein